MWKIVVPLLAAGFAVGLSALVGGFRVIDNNDVGAKTALQFAILEHNKATNDMFRRDMVDVVKTESQVVAGIKYRITVNMAKTNCRKTNESKDCGVPEGAQNYECIFTVVIVPWMNDIQLIDQKC